MRKNLIKNLTLFVVLNLLFTGSVHAQGAWDIAFVPISQIDDSWQGKEVRIDIKSENGVVDTADIRGLLSGNDELLLNTGDEEILLKEDWKIYPDHGVLKDQMLLTNSEWIIREQFIQNNHPDYIILKVVAYKKKGNELVKGAEEIFKVNKSDLNGVFYAKG